MTWDITVTPTTVNLPQDPIEVKFMSSKQIKGHPLFQQNPFIFPLGGKPRILNLKGLAHDVSKTIEEIYTSWLNQLHNWAESLAIVTLAMDGSRYDGDYHLVKFISIPKKAFMHTVWIQMELWKRGIE